MKRFFFFSLCLCVYAVKFCFAQEAVDPQNAALLAFKREQIALIVAENVRRALYSAPEYSEELAQTKARAAQIQKTIGDAAMTRLTFQERAYFASNDGSPQPYWVALPPSYTPRRKWPLIVYLHGYSTAISKIYPSIPPAEVVNSAQKLGFIIAMPYGRRNSDFVQWGQDDVMQVRNEVMRLYSVDEKRVFLSGSSMGGYGAYAAGLHTMGQWNAVAPVCGRTDFYLWFNITRNSIPAWKRALYDADDPRFLAKNARNTPFFVQHGALDQTVPVEHSRRYAADARVYNLPFRYDEQPDGDHYANYQVQALEHVLDWFQTLPDAGVPRQIQLVAVDLREAQNSWARVEAFQNYGEKATLNAKIGEDRIEVETQNVARFVLEPPRRYLKPGQLLTLVVNGLEQPKLFDPLQPIIWQTPDALLEKSPTRCGPFKNLMRDPFLLVYGDEKDHLDALHFAREWQDDADGMPRLKAASEVVATDKAAFNLILFGTSQSNPLLTEIGQDLPLELTPTGYRIGEKQVEGENLGLRMVWKSPWNAKRLIGVCSGAWWGEKLPVNHKWDLIPDYILYNGQTDADDTDQALEAGFFDGGWKVTETTP